MAVLATKLDHLIRTVNSIAKDVKGQGARITQTERAIHVMELVGGFLGAILVAVVIALVIRWLGL